MGDAKAISIRPLVNDEDSGVFQAAFDVLCDVFVESSAVHVALGVQAGPYRKYFAPHFQSMVAQGLSYVAVDDRTDEVVGVIVGCDFIQDADHSSEPGWITPLYELLDDLSARYHDTLEVGQGEIILVDMAAVIPGYEGRGIYRQLRLQLHERAREVGFTRVVGELSSAATQAVCTREFGHRVVSEIAFADFVYQGTRPFAAITEPPTIQLVEGRLNR